MISHKLDATNLLCPLPVIRTQNSIKTLATGDRLEVTCTDPGTMQDIPTWCRINGHTVLKTKQEQNLITICIEVGKNP